MKKNIFLGLGAAVLAVGGVFAGRASAKFATTSTLYYGTPGQNTCKTVGLTITSSHFQTTGSNPAVINTSGSTTTGNLYATSGCAKQVYLVP